MQSRPLLLIVFLSVCITLPSNGQEFPFGLDVPFPGVERFDSSIPTPEDVIGHQIGTKHTWPHQVVEYYRAVAAVSDRIIVEEHAKSYEGRPLIHAFATSPSNHVRLETIRRENLRLSDAPNSVGDRDLAGMPVVLYQGYSIHGNEASGTEAAMLYLYYLAAGQGPGMDRALDNAVIILDPMFNPDGRDRFTDWVNRNRGGVATADNADREHNEPWPGGRTNHYWFDLNRDWLPAEHPESRGRLEVFHAWRPQVLTDHHEMGGGATFFFQPGIPSRNNPNVPAATIALTGELATYHAKALDAIGSAYYSEESFDDFYVGKGSSYPDVNGTIGVLFEQASSRSLQSTAPDGILTYAFTVRNHFVASLSTLEGAIAMREAFLANQRDFYASSHAVADDSDVKGYVVSTDRGNTRAMALLELLARHRIKAYELNESISVDGVEFDAGHAFVLPLRQPQARLLRAAFERRFAFDDSLFYDVSTWTIPLAYDLDYAEVDSRLEAVQGVEVTRTTSDPGHVVGGRSEYAYLMAWDRQYAPRALYHLQAAGVMARVMREPFEAVIDGEVLSFEPGTVVVPVTGRQYAGRGDSGPNVHALIQEVVARDHVNVFAADTGLTPTGPDLGGASTTTLDQPKIALLTGAGSTSYSAGEIWHLLTERLRIPVSLVDVDRASRTDLSGYNTIIMAGGAYSDALAERIQGWVRAGGRLILQDSAMRWGIQHDLLDLEERTVNVDSLLAGRPFRDLAATRGAQAVGGAIFQASVDTTHPLGWGMESSVPVFHQGTRFYDPSDTVGATVAAYAARPLMSGYMSEERLEILPGAAAIVATRNGGGRVMAYSDRLAFRAFWHGSSRLLTNAIFFGGVY